MAQASEIESAAQQLAIGNIIGGNYRLVEKIGQGGMGLVFRASHVVIDSEYALKVLAPEQVNESSWLRFQSEARTMAALSHPTFVKVYDLGVHEGRLPFYTMDLLKGVSLESLVILKGSLPLKITVAIFLKILDGLAYAHRNGIVHRDLKPSNIMLCGKLSTKADKLVVKILDFGIAKSSDQDTYANQSLTLKGDLLGSPAYMSPEQCLGKVADTRSDIYSIGCCLFETLTGFIPFDGQSASEIISQHLHSAPPKLADMAGETFPESLEFVIARCLTKAPEERYQSAKELAIDLTRVSEGKDLKRYRSQILPPSATLERKQESAGISLLLPAIFLLLTMVVPFIGWLFWSTPKQSTKLPSSEIASFPLMPSEFARTNPAFKKEYYSRRIVGEGGLAKIEIHFPAQNVGEYALEGARLAEFNTVSGERGQTFSVSGVTVVDAGRTYWLFADSELVAHPSRLSAFNGLMIPSVSLDSTAPRSTADFCSNICELFSPTSLCLGAGSAQAGYLLGKFDKLRFVTLDGVRIGRDTLSLARGLENIRGVKFIDVEDVDTAIRVSSNLRHLTSIAMVQKTLSPATISLLAQLTHVNLEIDLSDLPDGSLLKLISMDGLSRLTIARRPWSAALVEALSRRRTPLNLRLMAQSELPNSLKALCASNHQIKIDLVTPSILGPKVKRVR